MDNLSQIVNSREMSAIIWITLFLMWVISDLKGLLLWFFGIAIIVFVNLADIKDNKKFFRNIVLGSLTIAALTEFIVNCYSFSLPVELVLFPTISFLTLTRAFSENKDGYKITLKVFDSILAIFGFVIIFFTLKQLYINYLTMLNLENVKSFLLPIAYSILLIPLIYFYALIVNYETIFIRIKINNPESDLINYFLFKIFITFNIRLFSLVNWSNSVGFLKVNEKREVNELLNK